MREYKLNDYAVSRLKLIVWRNASPRNLHEAVHRHDCVEMMYVVRGAGVCRVNGTPYPAARGDLFVMAPDDTHEFVTEHEFNYYNMLFSPDLFSAGELEQLRRFSAFPGWLEPGGASEKKFRFLPPACDEAVALAVATAEEFKYRAEGFELNAKAAFIRLLVYLLRQLDLQRLQQQASSSDSAVARAIHYLDRHCHENITLKAVARAAGVAESTLAKVFKRATGDAVFDYLGKIRIGRAQFELEHTGKTISQIAADLGYYDSSYFSRAFRRYAGMSPREYRDRRPGAKNLR